PRTFWSKRFSILRLASVTTVNSASPELTVPHDPGSQPPWMLGVAALASRPWLPSVPEEVTLFRELRTSWSPVRHVSVGYCGQHRRSCHYEKCMTVIATASCRTRTTKFSSGGRRRDVTSRYAVMRPPSAATPC